MTDDLYLYAPQWWLTYSPEEQRAAADLLQAMADAYQRDAIASAQSEQAFQNNVKEYNRERS